MHTSDRYKSIFLISQIDLFKRVYRSLNLQITASNHVSPMNSVDNSAIWLHLGCTLIPEEAMQINFQLTFPFTDFFVKIEDKPQKN